LRIGAEPSHRCNKAITASGKCLDTAALPSVLIEYSAQLRNLYVEGGFFDRSSRPDGLDDRIFRDHLALPCGQQAEQTNRARAEPDRYGRVPLTQAVQNATPAVETEAVEQENFGRTKLVQNPTFRPVRSCLRMYFAFLSALTSATRPRQI
jgi:hypothetical protein